MKKTLLSLGLSALLAVTLSAKEDVIVFHAGSLSVPFSQIEKAFEKKYPQYDVKREASGSRNAARKITDLHRKADVMASADYKVIDNLMIPNNAKFNAQFATNEMVIAYTKTSKFSKEINAKNWPDIFLRKGVKVAHSNPNMDPCGYRSVLVTKLAEDFYKKPGFYDDLLGYGDFYKNGEEKRSKVVVRPKEVDLIALLQTGVYDYLYIYKSVAEQHGFEYLELPKQVSLKDNEFVKFYKTATFKINGKKPGTYITKTAGAMVYGVTIPQNKVCPQNKKGAIKFVQFLLGEEGQKIMAKNGQGVISPAVITGNASIINK